MLEHGGRVRVAAARYGIPVKQWLDVSTGINPCGWPVPPLPPAVWQRLPEGGDGLEEAAAAYYGTTQVLPVAGSQAAIQALPWLRRPGRVGVVYPSYAEHPFAWQRAGHAVATVSIERLDEAVEQLEVLVLVHPNNPTGTRFSSSVLRRWRTQLAARGGWLVVDEAFMDVTPEDSLSREVGPPGLVVLRSLGKFFGLAGARVGFVLAEAALRESLQELLGPWTVSGPARWVAAQALRDRDWQTQARIELQRAGARLRDLLQRYGLSAAGGTALFQWVPSENAESWYHALARQGILVRRFSEPPGLRFGLPGDEAAWQRLERALASIRGGDLDAPPPTNRRGLNCESVGD